MVTIYDKQDNPSATNILMEEEFNSIEEMLEELKWLREEAEQTAFELSLEQELT